MESCFKVKKKIINGRAGEKILKRFSPLVKVLYDYQSQAFEELDITKGQIVPVIATHDDG